MRSFLGICGIAFLLLGCSKANPYPDEPRIRLEGFKLIPYVDGGALTNDSLWVKLYFSDGNGDLGLTAEERQAAPYAKYPPGDTVSAKFNYRYYNYLLTIFAENTLGRFDSIRDRTGTTKAGVVFIDEVSRYGAFQPTLDMQKGDPIEGYIEYGVTDRLIGDPNATPVSNRGLILKGRKYFLRVKIVDRGGNVSNLVTSDTLTY